MLSDVTSQLTFFLSFSENTQRIGLNHVYQHSFVNSGNLCVSRDSWGAKHSKYSDRGPFSTGTKS